MDEACREDDASAKLFSKSQYPCRDSKRSELGGNDGHEDTSRAGGEDDEDTGDVQTGIVRFHVC